MNEIQHNNSAIDHGIDVASLDNKTLAWISQHSVFHGISESDIKAILPYFNLINLRANEFLIQEGVQSSNELYLVLNGELEVIKEVISDEGIGQSEVSNKEFAIAHLGPGDAIGELSFIKGGPRSATVRSTTVSSLLSLQQSNLSKLADYRPIPYGHMMKNILGYLGERLKQTSTNEINAVKVKLKTSILNSKANLFFSYVIGLLCIYNLAVQLIISLSLDSNRASIVSATIILIFCGVLVLMIRHSNLPFKMFGLTTKNWKPALKESLLWTSLIVASMIAIKWILISTIAKYQDLPLFDFNINHQRYLAFNFLLYGLHSPVQEFIARGVLQGSLQHFFSGKNIVFRSIVISNALFSATHVHLLGGFLGVLVFIPGLFWGWLYSRNDNLIGVSISHILIGWTALFFLNLESLF